MKIFKFKIIFLFFCFYIISNYAQESKVDTLLNIFQVEREDSDSNLQNCYQNKLYTFPNGNFILTYFAQNRYGDYYANIKNYAVKYNKDKFQNGKTILLGNDIFDLLLFENESFLSISENNDNYVTYTYTCKLYDKDCNKQNEFSFSLKGIQDNYRTSLISILSSDTTIVVSYFDNDSSSCFVQEIKLDGTFIGHPIKLFSTNSNLYNFTNPLRISDKFSFCFIIKNNNQYAMVIKEFTRDWQEISSDTNYIKVFDGFYKSQYVVLKNGNYAITYYYSRPGGGGSVIQYPPELYFYIQFYSKGGEKISNLIEINEDKETYGINQVVRETNNGNLIAEWRDYNNILYGQYFSADGQKIGVNFKILTDENQSVFSEIMHEGKNFIFNYEEDKSIRLFTNPVINPIPHTIFTKIIEIGDTLSVSKKSVLVRSHINKYEPYINADKEGNFNISWIDDRNSNWDIYLQKYNTKGELLDTIINVTKSEDSDQYIHHKMVTNEKGDIFFVWLREENILGKFISKSGEIKFDNLILATVKKRGNPDFELTFSGDKYLVSWMDSLNVYIKLLDMNKNQISEGFKIGERIDFRYPSYLTSNLLSKNKASIIWHSGLEAKIKGIIIDFNNYEILNTIEIPNISPEKLKVYQSSDANFWISWLSWNKLYFVQYNTFGNQTSEIIDFSNGSTIKYYDISSDEKGKLALIWLDKTDNGKLKLLMFDDKTLNSIGDTINISNCNVTFDYGGGYNYPKLDFVNNNIYIIFPKGDTYISELYSTVLHHEFVDAVNINYKITLEIPEDNTIYKLTNGSFNEGENYFFNKVVVPEPYLDFEQYYSIFEGTRFSLDKDAIDENISLDIRFKGIDPNNLDRIQNPVNNSPLFMFWGIEVIGEQSGITPFEDYYYFNDGKKARLCIPKTEKLDKLLQELGIDETNLSFAFLKGGEYFNEGLEWEIKEGKEGEVDSVCIYLSHFSEIVGGKDLITSVDDKENNLPTEYSLFQNYPNPFNPTTTIKYSIPNVETQNFASLQIKIYDILGREVATLVNEKQKPGFYEVNFDGSGLASGIYYYRISAGKYMETKKMILLK
ncbi:MAG: T9SS type A sorting domain-containing protein [Melioribacteraceae bacterium]